MWAVITRNLFRYERAALLAWFLFIAVNVAVTSGATRWIEGGLATAGLAYLAWWIRYRDRSRWEEAADDDDPVTVLAQHDWLVRHATYRDVRAARRWAAEHDVEDLAEGDVDAWEGVPPIIRRMVEETEPRR